MEAPADQNRIRAKFGVLFSDGITLVPISINSSNGGMMLNTTDTVPANILALFTTSIMPRSLEYYKACWFGQSTTTGLPLPLFVDADGAVLVDM